MGALAVPCPRAPCAIQAITHRTAGKLRPMLFRPTLWECSAVRAKKVIALRTVSKIARPLFRLAEFTLSPFAPLRAVRSGKANGLATLSPQGGEGCALIFMLRSGRSPLPTDSKMAGSTPSPDHPPAVTFFHKGREGGSVSAFDAWLRTLVRPQRCFRKSRIFSKSSRRIFSSRGLRST